PYSPRRRVTPFEPGNQRLSLWRHSHRNEFDMSAILRFADRTTDRLLSLPRPAKRLVAVSSDLFLVIVTVWLAFVLRLEDFIPLSYPVLTAAATSAVIAVPVFFYFGLYNAIFRFAGTHALIEVGRAILVYAIVFS